MWRRFDALDPKLDALAAAVAALQGRVEICLTERKWRTTTTEASSPTPNTTQPSGQSNSSRDRPPNE